MEPLPSPPPEEPTVLDWFRSLLRLRPIRIPETPPDWMPPIPQAAPAPPREAAAVLVQARYLRLPAALALAFAGQLILEAAPVRDRIPGTGILLYLLAFGFVGWALWKNDLGLLETPSPENVSTDAPARATWLAAGAVLGVLTFLASSHNTFRLSTVVFWFGSMACLLSAFWEGTNPFVLFGQRVWAWVRKPRWALQVDGWAVGFWLVLGLAAWFRFAHVATVPLDMWSDQAEKLLDVTDVLDGKFSIFFTRNTGREALQFYMAAATARMFGTGISFLTLKIGTTFAGWVTLPFVYLFTREIAGRRAGLVAMLLAGVALWPNVFARTGLRFALYPLFAAPAMYLLVRGLRRQSRNDILLAGLVAGLGLHGYSPARVLPLVLAAGVGVYAIHRAARGQRARLLSWSMAATAVGVAAFMPLLRVALEMPDNFLFRSLSRLGTAERALPGPAGKILLSNLWNGLKMFNWDSGQIWVVSNPGHPLLDWVTAGLLVIGALLCLVRYARRRQWVDLFVLLSVPLLMLPSTLALAFPAENPAPNRASGVLVPVFALAGWALVAVADALAAAWGSRLGRSIAAAVCAAFLGLAVVNNYVSTFDVFYPAYRERSWNTADGGAVIRGFAESVGDYETAHVIPYAYWWDTRLVGIQAGQPRKDYAIRPDDIPALAFEPGPQLFLFNVEDVESLSRLRTMFPAGQLRRFMTEPEGHDFMIYFVPQQTVIP